MAEGDKPSGDKPAVGGDDGKWTKCEEPAAVENGFVRCKRDTCIVKCADGFMVEGSAKSKVGSILNFVIKAVVELSLPHRH